MPKDIDKLIELIVSTGRKMHERGGIHGDERHLSSEQFHALACIQEQKSPLMKDVAAHLCITPPSATVLINLLVKAGLIEREADTSDRRTVRIKITPKGKEELKAAKAQKTKKMKTLLKSLNTEDLKNLIVILKKFSANI